MSASAAEVGVHVSIEQGESFAANAAEDSLLRAALRAGIGFPHECSVGGCGACRFELLEGQIDDLWTDAPGLNERDRKRGKRLACQSRLRGDVRIKVRCDAAYRPVVAPTRRSFALVRRRMLTHDMAELSFETSTTVNFLPGQYALLYLPGIQGPRAYSMSNVLDGSGRLQFIVRRTPDGHGSGLLVDRLAIGQHIDIDGPYGHAYLREKVERPIVCIAGGSGLAPMLSVVHRAATSMSVPVEFFFGGRSIDDLCAAPLLEALPGYGTRIRIHNVVSGDTDGRWQGATGWVHDEVDRVIGERAGSCEFYFAGPPSMIESLQELLMVRRKVDFGQIHFDRFV
jgi:toluene monooxygenase electron transfer component